MSKNSALPSLFSEALGQADHLPGDLSEAPPVALQPDLTSLVIPLLKGVLYREEDGALWTALLALQARVRDYVAVLALDLVLDEREGYAFLRAKPLDEDTAAKLLAETEGIFAETAGGVVVGVYRKLLREGLIVTPSCYRFTRRSSAVLRHLDWM